MEEKVILTQEELSKIQEMNSEFTKTKKALGDLEMQKHNILKSIDLSRGEFAKYELELITKYGQDSIINVQTGEVTKKTN
jgi:hypothetical protein